ncbi:integrase [Kitasatospora sp. NPDC006697]|uniref:integrase n=1 Tax=Kitasatospora sp. NPDC006697 TaxID=3364020 RepID=UPI0036789AB3
MTAVFFLEPVTVTTTSGPIPADWAHRSVFAGEDICRAAGWEVTDGAHRPNFDEDLWDLSGLAHLPRSIRASAKRLDFTRITDPVFRLTAKEYLFALIAPQHQRVIELPDAFRDSRKPTTCYNALGHLANWLNWLTGQGLGSLTEVLQEHCDAYRTSRRRRSGDGPLAPGAMVGVLQPVQYLAFYRDLFTADSYLPGFVPWKGHTVSEVAGWQPGRVNTAPAVPDAVFQPTVAAALYLVETIGPHLAAEFETMLRVHEEGQSGSLLEHLSPSTYEVLREALEGYVREKVPLPRIDTPRIKVRLTMGWDANDPLLEVNTHRVVHRAVGRGGMARKLVEQTRPLWENALALAGLEEEFGRDAALVPRADDKTPVPWTLPTSAHDLRRLHFVVLGACRLVTGALSGMRASELDEISADSPMAPVTVPGGTQRFRLASKLIKGQVLGGVREEWVVLEPAYRAVQLAARLNRASGQERAFAMATMDYIHQRLREWVNGSDGQRLGLAPIPAGPVNGRMLRRTVALAIAHRPGGLLAAKIQLKHLSVVTTEGYAHRPGGSQAALLSDIEQAEQERNLELTTAAWHDYQQGRMPAGPGARDLIAAFEHIDAELADHTPGAASVLDSDRRLENLLRKQAKHLHLGTANYCWFRDPAKALCLRLAGTPKADKPLAGMCDSARCSQATHHPCHLPVWEGQVADNQVFLGNPRFPKAEKARLMPEIERALRVVEEIKAAAKLTEGAA